MNTCCNLCTCYHTPGECQTLGVEAQYGEPVVTALRKEPPALPAEVEAVLAKLELQSVVPNQEMTIGEVRVTKQCLRDAATLLRRYAQAVAEKDATISEMDDLLLARTNEREAAEKKLQAVEALCGKAVTATIAYDCTEIKALDAEAILAILREEH